METTKLIKGTLKMFYYGISKFDKSKTPRYILSLVSDALDMIKDDEEVKQCYEKAVMLPAWYKGESDTINLKSLYNIPVRYNEHIFDSSDFISDYAEYIKNATVTIKVKFKNGGAYPVSINIENLGEKQPLFNPFEGGDIND